MLFGKDLKVALAAVFAAVGLFGFNMAHATVYITPSTMERANNKPVYFAKEAFRSITMADGMRSVMASSTRAAGTDFTVADTAIDAFLAPVAGGSNYYLRFDLGDMAFADDAPDPVVSITAIGSTSPSPASVTRAARGLEGHRFGIWLFEAPAAGSTAGDWGVSFPIAADGISLPAGAPVTGGPTCFSITLGVYDSYQDARLNSNALMSGSAPLACLVETVKVSFANPQTLEASVAEAFRKFTGTANGGTLGTAKIEMTEMVGDTVILSPDDGMAIARADVLTRVEYTFSESKDDEFDHSGPFQFGNFTLGGGALARYDSEDELLTAVADDDTTKAEAEAVVNANTVTVGRHLTALGNHAFAVDVSGNPPPATVPPAPPAMNPFSAIGEGTYAVSWQVVIPGDSATRRARSAGSAANAGKITRDGTTVKLGYLTTATEFAGRAGAGYNQRLVITNHGSLNAEVMVGDWVVEDGAQAPAEPWTAVVPANQQLVTRVAGEGGVIGDNVGCRMMDDDGDCVAYFNRAAATLTATAKASDVSVFTTTVTKPEGQTDTVRYWPLQ